MKTCVCGLTKAEHKVADAIEGVAQADPEASFTAASRQVADRIGRALTESEAPYLRTRLRVERQLAE